MKTLKQVKEMYKIVGFEVEKKADFEGYKRYFIIDESNGNEMMAGKNIDELITTYKCLLNNIESNLQDVNVEWANLELFEILERKIILRNRQKTQEENDAQRLHTLELIKHLTTEESELLNICLTITSSKDYYKRFKSNLLYNAITENLAKKTAKQEYETLKAFKLYYKLALQCADEYSNGQIDLMFTERNIRTVGDCMECLNRNKVLIKSLEI